MILVNHFKVKGITAMFCSLTHEKPESDFPRLGGTPYANRVGEFIRDGARRSLREADVRPDGIRIGPVRVSQEARERARAGSGREGGRNQSATRLSFDLESKHHEQKSRGFA